MVTTRLSVMPVCSSDRKKNVRSLSRGPPSVAPHCSWLYRSFLQIRRVAEDVELLEVAPGVEALVAKVEIGVAPQCVGAALGHDVDHATRGFSELGRVGISQDLELTDGFLAEDRSHGADDDVVVVETVDHDVVGPCALSGEGQPGRQRGALLRCVVGRNTRRDDREADEVPSVDRKAVDLLLVDERRQPGTVRLHKRFLARDRDRLLRRRDGQCEVERDRLAEKQVDVLTLLRGEAASCGGDDVFARRKGRHRVASARLGFRRSYNVRLHIRDGDGRLDQHPAGLIDDRSTEVGARDASLGGAPRRDQQECDERHEHDDAGHGGFLASRVASSGTVRGHCQVDVLCALRKQAGRKASKNAYLYNGQIARGELARIRRTCVIERDRGNFPWPPNYFAGGSRRK